MTVTRPRTEAPRRRPPTSRLGRVGTRGGRAAFLGTGPTAWYDARDLLTTTQQTLTNRVGTSTATLGSTGGSDTNDPTGITHSGTDCFWFPGTANNYVNIVDIDLTGDLYLDATVEVPASRASMEIISDRAGSTGEAALRFNSAGTHLELFWFEGGVAKTATSSVAHSLTAGSIARIAVARDNDGSGGNWLVRFYTGSGIGGAVSQLGADVTGAAPAAPTSSATGLRLAGGTVPFSGKIYSGYAYNNFTGTGNPLATYTPGGGGLTVIRSTSGLTTAVVTRPLLAADGTDDYLALAAGDIPTFTASTGAYTVMLVNRVHNLAGAATLSRVWSSESASNNGAHIYLDQTSAQYKVLVGGATTTATTDAAAFTQTTQLHAVAAVFDNGTAKAYSTTTGLTAGVDTTGVGTITHASAPRIGSRADSVASPADFETYAAVHWTRALTETELATAATYLTGTYT